MMKKLIPVLLVLLFLGGLLPIASAQPQFEALRVLEDPTGDFYAQLKNGPGINDPTGHYDFEDMEWLEVTESSEGYTFTIKVVSIEVELDNTIGFSDGGYMSIYFTHNDWQFKLTIERPSGQFEITYLAMLESKFVDAPDWGFMWLDRSGPEFDLSANTISMFVSREDLADSRGAAPYPGRELTDFYVIASQRSSDASADFNGQELGFPYQFGDRMPDTGVGSIPVPTNFGLQQTGFARLSSKEPYRASNGEATTFLYTVNATNLDSKPGLFSLQTSGGQPGWSIQLPLAAIQLGPNESISVPVLLNTQFSHAHGGTSTFLLEMVSTSDSGSVGRIELGVRYLEVPQPAGHHDKVYFHSIPYVNTVSFNTAFQNLFGQSGSLYFNTNQVDESDEAVPVSASGGFFGSPMSWTIPLDPTLRLGLDFNLEKLGEVNFDISSPVQISGATLEGVLQLRQAGDGRQSGGQQDAIVLANFSETGFTLSGSKSFLLDVTPTPESDYIPYDPANQLYIVIQLRGTTLSVPNQNSAPKLLPGGSMTIPLFEYHDDITDAFDALAGLSFENLTSSVRTANPGSLVRFDLDATAIGNATGTYELSLLGTNLLWAEIATPVKITAGENKTRVTVLVDIPSSAVDGDRADIFLQAVHKDDPQRRGVIRLLTNVDTDATHPDDRAISGDLVKTPKKKSPDIAIIPTVALLAAVALARRRSL